MINITLNRKSDFDKTREDFRKVLWIYDFWSRLTESRAFEKVIELAEVKNNQSIIEIACGTGRLLERIVKMNPDGRNLGLDLSPDMLRRTELRLKGNGLKNYELREGNVLQLKEKSGGFDILLNNFMVDLMPEDTFDIIANQFYRLLKPNGTAVVSTFSFGTRKIHRFWFWLAKHAPDLLTGCRPVAFKQFLEKAGFDIIEIHQVSQNTLPTEIIKVKKMNIPGE